MGRMRVAKWGLLAVLGGLGAVAQGRAIFWYMEPSGPFLGRAGLQCIGIPLLFELVLLVVFLKNLDQIHAGAVSNPHSLLGQSVRNDSRQSAASPPPSPTPASPSSRFG